uniref:Uncharacterized protein n=1 Tax=Lepeophtheirus salmonis TaxID=72036 RepID=A0A0K2UBN4_LEPSM
MVFWDHHPAQRSTANSILFSYSVLIVATRTIFFLAIDSYCSTTVVLKWGYAYPLGYLRF